MIDIAAEALKRQSRAAKELNFLTRWNLAVDKYKPFLPYAHKIVRVLASQEVIHLDYRVETRSEAVWVYRMFEMSALFAIVPYVYSSGNGISYIGPEKDRELRNEELLVRELYPIKWVFDGIGTPKRFFQMDVITHDIRHRIELHVATDTGRLKKEPVLDHRGRHVGDKYVRHNLPNGELVNFYGGRSEVWFADDGAKLEDLVG